MNKYKKFSIIVLSLLLFVFTACPIFAITPTPVFMSDYWINSNGYWVQDLPAYVKIELSKIDWKSALFAPEYYNSLESTTKKDNYVQYKYSETGGWSLEFTDTSLGSPLLSVYQPCPYFIYFCIDNGYYTGNYQYSTYDKEKIITECNRYGLVYQDNSSYISVYFPKGSNYFKIQYYNNGWTSSAKINTISYDGINYYSPYICPNGNRVLGYEYRYGFDTDYNLVPSYTILNTTATGNYEQKQLGYLLLRPNGLMYQRSNYYNDNNTRYLKSALMFDLTYDNDKNRNNRNYLNIAVNLACFPSIYDPSNSTLKSTMDGFIDLYNSLQNNKHKDFISGLYPMVDYGVYKFAENFFNGNNQPLPVDYCNVIYNTHTYYNNRNNYYWWGILNYNPDDGSGDIENPDDSNPSGGGSGSGGSGGGSSGGSGGDSSITIDTQNIENLLQQILEALQNQGTTEVDLTEIENLLNAIKNNLKDYTGDLTTINNTLTLINQFLNNNIDVPISDLKSLLNDLKTLSEFQKEQLTGISAVLHDMKQLFLDIYNRLGEIKDKIGGTINNIEEGTNLWDVLKALIDNLGNFLSSGLELFEKLLVPQGTFETDFNSTITGIQDKLGVLYQPVDIFSNFLTNLYAPSETSTLADSGHVIKIPEAKYDGVTIIEAQSIDLDETVEKSGLKPLYDVYLLIVDMIVLFGILNLAFKKFHDIISENGGDYK